MQTSASPAATDELIRQRADLERGRRCVQRGTLQTAWYRDQRRYVAHPFARSISRVCDSIIADALAGVSSWWALEAPPRHGKSEHVGRAMPGRLMALMPGASVLYATSTDERAVEVSMAARSMVGNLAPSHPHLAKGAQWEQTNWLTVGGGRFVGVGAGGATGGIGGNLGVIDDVTGSAERQRSRAWKAGNRRWILEDVVSRIENGPLVIMGTRRGLDDEIGWLESEHPGKVRKLTWQHVATEEVSDPMGRASGEYLWPDRYGAAWRAQMPHLVDSSPIWQSLHQQRPTAEGGEVVHTDWTSHRYPSAPSEMRRACRSIMLFADTSSTTADKSDPTAIQVWGLQGIKRVLLYAEVLKPYDLTQRIVDLCGEWRPDGVGIEATSIGHEIARGLEKAAANTPGGQHVRGVMTLPVSGRGDKIARMAPFIPEWMGGHVLLPASAPWVARYVGEITTVPAAPHDDEWDCTSLALTWYAERAAPQEVRSVRGVW